MMQVEKNAFRFAIFVVVLFTLGNLLAERIFPLALESIFLCKEIAII